MTQLTAYQMEDYQKPLKIKFVGEEGIDEGSISFIFVYVRWVSFDFDLVGGLLKEFFQLIVLHIFDPGYGMFVYNEENRTVWFNRNSLDTGQFTLVGIVCVYVCGCM